ncbi:hypothetical protein [Streptomyces broussonetiae]|nr:hypothetical protein [Streptomyces broussonetiae]
MEAALAACAARDEDWLEHMLRKPPYEMPTPSFWHRHRHDRLVERWARVVGADRVTVVVVDDRNRDGLMRAFETLLGLPENLIQPVPDASNRSLTRTESEMLRNLNVEFRRNGLPEELYSWLVRNGAVPHMKKACGTLSAEMRIVTPCCALEAAGAIGAEATERIAALGVRVLAGPALLSAVPRQPDGSPDDLWISPETAARALCGAFAAVAGRTGVRSVHQTSPKELVRVLGRRCLKPFGQR